MLRMGSTAKTFSRHMLYALYLFMFTLSLHAETPASTRPTAAVINIGAFPLQSVYYKIAQNFCKILLESEGLSCKAHPTNGSIENVNNLQLQKMQAGYASTVTFDAVKRKEAPFTNSLEKHEITALFSLHPAIFAAYTYADSAIKTFDDALGHKIDIGHNGAVEHTFMTHVFTEKKWQSENFKQLTRIRPVEFSRQLCSKKLDLYVIATVHPTPFISNALKRCPLRFVSMKPSFIEKMVTKYPIYTQATIPANLYPHQSNPMIGLSSQWLFLVRKDMNEPLAYKITKSIFDNFNLWHNSLSPKLETLTPHNMAHKGLIAADIHPGAMRYYREVGLYPR